MWVELNNTWYNLSNSYKISLHDDQVIVYFIGDASPTLIRSISKEETILIKNFLNGRNS